MSVIIRLGIELCKLVPFITLWFKTLLPPIFRDLRERPAKPTDTSETKRKEDGESSERCGECRRLLDDPDLKMFTGDSNDAVSVNLAYLRKRRWNTLNLGRVLKERNVEHR